MKLMQKSHTFSWQRFDWLRLAIHLVSLYYLLQISLLWLTSGLGANPIQFIEQHLGRAAVNLLVLTLAVTPLVNLTGWKKLVKHRRTLGLYTFVYFALHFLVFAVLDYGLNWLEILRLVTEKTFIIVGVFAGLILFALAVTSFKFWMKRLGKNWKRLHKLVYLASGLVVLHYALAVKGSITNLSGEVYRPLSIGVLMAVLFILRVPPVRRLMGSLRQSVRKVLTKNSNPI